MIVAHTGDPVAEGIAAHLAARGYESIRSDDPGRLVAASKASIAIGDPLGFARNLGLAETALVPGAGLILDGLTGYVRLAFRPGIQEIKRIASRNVDRTDSIVAGLVLIEKHGIEPEFVALGSEADLPLMLENSDGAVIDGIDALGSHRRRESGLDLAEEWQDLADAPLPYVLVWGSVDAVTQGVVDEIGAAAESFRLSLPDLAARHDDPEAIEALHEAVLSGSIGFDLSEETAGELLTPLYHYAFYHGVIDDIPSIRFLPISEEESADAGK